MKSYVAEVGFCGFIGCSEEYTVCANSENEAKMDALEQAAEDLSVENVEDLGDGSYEVEIGFCGFVGCSENYTVSADSDDEAEEEALLQAQEDLEIIGIDEQ